MTRKYEQRRRAEAAEATRRRILDAVHHQLTTEPAQPPSVEQIAERAGVSRSTVYLIFGSRAGLFDAFTRDLVERAGFAELVDAVAHPDALEHLRGGIRASSRMFAAEREVLRVLFSMSAIDPDAVGGAVLQQEGERAGGIAHLAHRLAEQERLSPGVSEAEAADVLWLLSSFDTFDSLATGRGLSADDVSDRLITLAERTLCRS
jgi:AcrR family transcriptional regulator